MELQLAGQGGRPLMLDMWMSFRAATSLEARLPTGMHLLQVLRLAYRPQRRTATCGSSGRQPALASACPDRRTRATPTPARPRPKEAVGRFVCFG
jgi:hypothetical protein